MSVSAPPPSPEQRPGLHAAPERGGNGVTVPAPRTGDAIDGARGPVLAGFDPWADDEDIDAGACSTGMAAHAGVNGAQRSVEPPASARALAAASARGPRRRARMGSRCATPATRTGIAPDKAGWAVGQLMISARDITGSVSAVMGALLFVSGLVLGAAPLVFSGAMLVYVAATVLGPQV